MFRSRVTVIVSAVLGLFLLGFGLTLIMKLQLAGEQANKENKRRESMKVDQQWPDWFRNLDRNTDGKLTRAEFIGSDEQFRQYDTDADGFLSPEEATAADEHFRSQIPP